MIASREASRARFAAEGHGIPHAAGSYQACVESDQVDGIYVALPPSLHHQWTMAAIAAGKHVLCEKPIATSAEQTRAMYAAADAAGVRLLDATGWPHHPRSAMFADWIASGRLGQLRHISTAVSFYEPFQSDEHRLDAERGGGCLLDLGWYAFGLAIAAAGRFERVASTTIRRSGVPMRVAAVGELAGGVQATISCGYDTASRKWMEIAGDEASLICDDFTRPWPDRPVRCWVHRRDGSVESETFDDPDGHIQERRMIAAWIDPEVDLTPHRQRSLATAAVIDAVASNADGWVSVND